MEHIRSYKMRHWPLFAFCNAGHAWIDEYTCSNSASYADTGNTTSTSAGQDLGHVGGRVGWGHELHKTPYLPTEQVASRQPNTPYLPTPLTCVLP